MIHPKYSKKISFF